jgi:uridine kinase
VTDQADFDNAVAVINALAAERQPLLVAVDGGSGAGKSVIAERLSRAVGGTVVHGDDFFRATYPADGWARLTPARRRELVFDWDRLRSQAIEPLMAGQQTSWHPFDTSAPDGLSTETVCAARAPIVVLDCIYSSQPELADLVDLTVLVSADPAVRRNRHNLREGGPDTAWHAIWDPVEDYFFTEVRTPESFDVIIRNHP